MTGLHQAGIFTVCTPRVWLLGRGFCYHTEVFVLHVRQRGLWGTWSYWNSSKDGLSHRERAWNLWILSQCDRKSISLELKVSGKFMSVTFAWTNIRQALPEKHYPSEKRVNSYPDVLRKFLTLWHLVLNTYQNDKQNQKKAYHFWNSKRGKGKIKDYIMRSVIASGESAVALRACKTQEFLRGHCLVKWKPELTGRGAGQKPSNFLANN